MSLSARYFLSSKLKESKTSRETDHLVCNSDLCAEKLPHVVNAVIGGGG